jgi:hypothetical protein
VKLRLERLQRTLWEPRQNPLIYFLAAFFFALSVNLISSEPWLPWVKRIVEWAPPLGILVLLLSPAVRRFWPWGAIDPATKVREARPCKGLVVFASQGPGIATAAKAVAYHLSLGDPLQALWIVCSHSSADNADRLRRDLALNHPDLETEVVTMTDDDFQDVEAVQQRLETEVYGSLHGRGWWEGDVVLDFTGGAKNTTAGAILAGLPANRRLEFVPAEKKNEEGRATGPEAAGNPREIRIDYRMKRLKDPR